VEYFIGIILIVITLFIIVLILRKRVYDQVDRLEMWKMDIMNRNTAAELARVKGLNLSGETQEKFEAWKAHWEHIVTQDLPDVEELLFEAEDAADRYRFPTAKKVLQKIEHVLGTIEDDIERMINELHELLKTEETSRKEIEALLPDMASLRKYLTTNKHRFGNAYQRFTESVDALAKDLDTYHTLVEEGNYLEASERVDQIKEALAKLNEQVEEFPDLLRTCTEILPQQLKELADGLQEMIEDGYRIQEMKLEEEVENYQKRLEDCVQSLEKGTVSEVKVIIKEIDERITDIYDLLEKEAIAKNYIETQWSNYQENLKTLKEQFTETKAEVDMLRKAYYFEDDNMERYLMLDKSITKLDKQFDEFSEGLENESLSYTELRDSLQNGFVELEELAAEHETFKVEVHNLRKEELEAKEKLHVMREQLLDLHRQLRKSNIPGVPNYIWDIMENASNLNERVIQSLKKQPLDMGEVQHALSEAAASVERAVEQTEIMLDQAYLTEQVIQYANRYRSRYPLLAAKLSESEKLFRSYEYELSLERAAEAVEEIEPGALKLIENNQKVL